jgi:hypothetical protein
MANTCGKAYGLTAITRMNPWKTYGLRLVFFLIQSSLKAPWHRSAIFVAFVSALVIPVVELLGWLWASHLLPGGSRLSSMCLAVGVWVGFSGMAAWLVGLVVIVAALALVGAIVGRFWQPRWTLLGRISQVQTNLIDLSFIHFARWVIVPKDQFPHFGDEKSRESLHYDYLIFESNFNGDWEKYIDAFSQVVPGGMDNIWRWSVRYPKSVPISPFLNYIRNCQYDTDHYYSAYPGAATNDVRGALLLQTKIAALAKRAAKLTPAQFVKEYALFTIEVQNCIATTGVPPQPPAQASRGVALPSSAVFQVPSTAASVSAH